MPGFITIRNLVLVIIVLVILGLAGVNVEEDIAGNETVQENTSYVASGVSHVWNTYLAGPADFIWNDVIVGILWETFVQNMERLRDGQPPTDFTSENLEDWPSIPEIVDEYNANN